MAKSTTRKLIDHILSGNTNSADVITQHLLTHKLNQAKDGIRLAVANKLYSSTKEEA